MAKERVKRIRKVYIRKKSRCEDCGKEISLRSIRCSSCAQKKARKDKPNWYSENAKAKKRGKNNPNWKGGKWKKKNSLENSIRRTRKYRNWRESILKRDINTYPFIPLGLQVHHIESFRQMIEKNKIRTREEAMLCQELWETDNGVTLTKGEHYVLTLLERKKAISKGLIRLLKQFVIENKNNYYPWCRATELDKTKSPTVGHGG